MSNPRRISALRASGGAVGDTAGVVPCCVAILLLLADDSNRAGPRWIHLLVECVWSAGGIATR